MERGAVVPHIVRLAWFPSGHINGNPLYLCGALSTEPCLRCFEGFFRKIKDGGGAITWTVLKTWSIGGISDSIGLNGFGAKACGDSQGFSISMIG
jgi:hypothetical protein